MDDASLVAAIRAGERDAFRLLVDRETRPLYRLAYRIAGDAAEAEDIVQETFIVAFRSLHSYRGDGSLRAWLMTTATRIAYRQKKNRPETPGEVALEAALETATAGGRAADPTSEVLMTEQLEAVRAAVAGLPQPYREVLTLHYFAELSVEEVAAAVGRPLATTRSHLRRGLIRLRLRVAAGAAA